MEIKKWTFLCLIFIGLMAKAGIGRPDEDSTKVKSTFMIVPRLNSTGHFPYTGSVINRHVNADVNFFFDKTRIGFFLFKSYDPVDPHSIINYLQPGAFLTLRPHSPFRIRVIAGYVFSQTAHFRDTDSDFNSALIIYWDVLPRVKIQHTALYYDIQTTSKLTNRLLVTWESKSWKVDTYFWHRWVMEAHSGALSASMATTYSLKVSERSSIQLTGSFMTYLTKEMPSYAMRRGLIFTMAVPLDVHM